MTRDQFIKVLNKNGYKWREEEELIIVKGPAEVDLIYLETIPDNVRFDNRGYVYLESLKSIPDNIQFNNRGSVYLDSLKSLPDNVKFNNGGDVYIRSLKSMGDNAQFNNGGFVNLRSLESMGDNVQFNNGGDVYLDSLESIPVNSDSDEMFSKCRGIRINNLFQDIPQNKLFRNSRWKRVNKKVKMYESWIKNNY